MFGLEEDQQGKIYQLEAEIRQLKRDREQEIYYTIATQKTANMGHGMGNRTDYIIEPLPLEGSYGYATSKEYPPLFTNKGEAGIYKEEFHNGLGVIVEMKVQLSIVKG